MSTVVALYLVFLFVNATSIFGFAVFGLHPEFLAKWSWAPPIFASSYPFFAQLQIALAFAVLAAQLTKGVGRRWIPAFILVFLLSAGSELMGTTYGIPFGKYAYTELLGWKLFDRVPLLIPVSWFFMALPSFMVGHRALSGFSSPLSRILAGAVLLLTWDLTLDPAMSFLTPFWLWDDVNGVFYGMPLGNLAGWFVTGIVIMLVFELLQVQRWAGMIKPSWWQGYYLANLMLPLGMCMAAGLWDAISITVVVLGPCLVSERILRKRGPARPSISNVVRST